MRGSDALIEVTLDETDRASLHGFIIDAGFPPDAANAMID